MNSLDRDLESAASEPKRSVEFMSQKLLMKKQLMWNLLMKKQLMWNLLMWKLI
jgi:hypothetical protein